MGRKYKLTPGRKHKLTKREEDVIRKLLAKGFTRNEMAAMFEVSLSTIVRVDGIRKSFRVTDDVRIWAINQVQQGSSARQVAAVIGVNPTTVTSWCHAFRLSDRRRKI